MYLPEHFNVKNFFQKSWGLEEKTKKKTSSSNGGQWWQIIILIIALILCFVGINFLVNGFGDPTNGEINFVSGITLLIIGIIFVVIGTKGRCFSDPIMGKI